MVFLYTECVGNADVIERDYMNNTVNNKRESGLDLVRAVACFFVVAVHFYLNCGYYNEPMVGIKMFIMSIARWLFMTSVPLFFMLTGYFKLNKVASGSHYKALGSLFISYVIISVAKMFLYNRLFGKIYFAKDMLANLANYQIAWYMGMYLCLFLLIPFLNKMWHALNDKEKNILIVTLIFLCAIYPLVNYVAPSFFVGIYPIMYYFLGAYIREKQPILIKSKWANFLALMAVAGCICIVESLISMKCTKTGLFDWTVISTADGGYGSLLVAICSVCIFLALYMVNIKSRAVNVILSSISKVSFEIYLFAGAYDAIIYQYLKRSLTSATQFFWWFFVTVPLSFICAYISSVVFKKIVSIITLERK